MKHFSSIIIGAVAAIIMAVPAWADVAVTKNDAAKTIVVDVTNASVDQVLGKVGEEFGFTTERNGAAEGPALSGRYEGPLDVVLSRILRGEGHMIERSATAQSGIVRIVLFGSTNPGAGTAVAQRQGRHRPTQAATDDEEAMAQAEAEEAEAEQARIAQQEALQARQMRRNRAAPQQRPRLRDDGN